MLLDSEEKIVKCVITVSKGPVAHWNSFDFICTVQSKDNIYEYDCIIRATTAILERKI